MTQNNAADSKAWQLNSSLAARMRQTIRERRRGQPFRFLAQLSEKYLRAFYNEGFFEFTQNGEAFAMRCFQQWKAGEDLLLWDVGANTGGWAKEALSIFPEAKIHSFEILSPIADAYIRDLGANDRLQLHRMGLSDASGEVEVTWNTQCHSTSAINYRDTSEFGDDLTILKCTVSTVDAQIAAGLPAPDLLKIDTEGHDAAVLRGANKFLAGLDAPAMIQFEYGETWLPAKETLEQCQKQLEDYGYSVGRLYPTHVEFKPYAYCDDHFRMGNMIAVRDSELKSLLAG